MNNNMIPSFSCPWLCCFFLNVCHQDIQTRSFLPNPCFPGFVQLNVCAWVLGECLKKMAFLIEHKARVSFAIAVTCNILLHYVTCIFLLHTWTQWLFFRASSVLFCSQLCRIHLQYAITLTGHFKSVNVLLFAFNQVRGGGVGVPWMSKATWCKAICVVNLNGCATSIPTLNMLTINDDLLLWKPGTFFWLGMWKYPNCSSTSKCLRFLYLRNGVFMLNAIADLLILCTR